MIPRISAPGTLRATRAMVITRPARKVRMIGLNGAACTTVNGSALMNLAFTRPISAMNRPMPQEIALRRLAGMPSITAWRTLKKASTVKITLAQSTQPRAICSGILAPTTMV